MSQRELNTNSDHSGFALGKLLFSLTVLLRLLPHPANFAPMGATSLFGGAKLPKRYVFIYTLIAVFVTDYLLLYINPFAPQIFDFSQIHALTDAFHDTTFFVYFAFMVSTGLGLYLRNKKFSLVRVGSVAFLSAVLFFVITNFGVFTTGIYGYSLSGLITCYTMALPFFGNTLASELFYSISIFGIYELASKYTSQPVASQVSH